MSQKSGNNVKPPVHEDKKVGSETGTPTIKDALNDQHHGENQESPQEDRKIGQSTGTGRPPLMKK